MTPNKFLVGGFWAFLALYVMVLPIGETIALRNVGFAGLLATTVALLSIRRQPPCFPLAVPWAIYGLLALASVAYAVDPEYSLREVKAEVFYGIAIFVVAATWGRHAEVLHGLCALVVAGNLLMITGTVWQAAHLSGQELMLHPSIRAGAGNYSTYIVTVLPVIGYSAWRQRRARRHLLAFGLASLIAADLAALVITLNRQGFLSVAFAGMVAGYFFLKDRPWRRRVAATAALLCVLTTLVGIQVFLRAQAGGGPDEASTGEVLHQAVSKDTRWPLWSFAVAQIMEKPFSGGGFGREAFKMLHPDYHRTHTLLWHAHNMVLNKGVQMGLPGMAAFLLLWAATAREFARRLNAPAGRHPIAVAGLCLLASVFLKNMTDDFFVRDGALLFWLLAGTLIGTLRRGEDQARASS